MTTKTLPFVKKQLDFVIISKIFLNSNIIMLQTIYLSIF